MTQAEVDARLCIINQEFAEKRYQVNKDHHTAQQRLKEQQDEYTQSYNEQVTATMKIMDEVMRQRNELRRNGVQAFNPEMEANYQRERELHNTNRANKERWLTYISGIKRRRAEEQMAFETAHKELRKAQHDAQCHVYEEYYKSVSQSVSQSENKCFAYGKLIGENSQPES